MKAFAHSQLVACFLLLAATVAASANEPYTPGIPVAPESALAERAIEISLPEFEKLGVVHDENYTANISQTEISIFVVFVDQADCRSEEDSGSLRHPIVLVVLNQDATRVTSSHVNRIAVCPRS